MSYNELKGNNASLKAGYITMSEQNPISGRYFADSKLHFENLAFCVAENSAKGKPFDNGLTWNEFILQLVS